MCQGFSRGVALPNGQTMSASPNPAYVLEGPKDYVSPPPTSDATPSVHELLL